MIEICGKNVLCLSNEPTSGEGGNPIYFAGRHKNSNGYLVVVSIPQEKLNKKIVCVLDNKVLDDYVRFHFFVREEFRKIGHSIFLALKNWQTSHPNEKFVGQGLGCPLFVDENTLVSNDQRVYYRDIGIKPQVLDLLGISISDLFFQFIKKIGTWDHFYHFLELHYAHISPDFLEKFNLVGAHLDNANYWKEFYRRFPQPIQNPRDFHIREWFSPCWLESRKSSKVQQNCQILLDCVEPNFICGFIQVTNGSNIVQNFKERRPDDIPKRTMSQRIWRAVNRILKKS